MTTTRIAAPRRLRETMLARVEKRLAAFLAADRAHWAAKNPASVELVDCVAEMVGGGGKRLRPSFLLAGYLAAGGDPESGLPVDAAAAVELLHTSALLHDDVIDQADLRRGRPTAHRRHAHLHGERGWQGESGHYGESVALLAGNLALVQAERLLEHCPLNARRVWSDLTTEVMMGQFLDARSAARSVPDPDLARWIALFKSGRYTVAQPLVMGAALAGDEALRPALEEYGLALGEAFQLRDDLLDAFGEEAETGKSARLDFSSHKMTLLMSIALHEEPEVAALVRTDLRGTDPEQLHKLLLATGMKERVETVIDKRLRTAIAVAERALRPEWAGELRAMAVAAAHRTS